MHFYSMGLYEVGALSFYQIAVLVRGMATTLQRLEGVDAADPGGEINPPTVDFENPHAFHKSLRET